MYTGGYGVQRKMFRPWLYQRQQEAAEKLMLAPLLWPDRPRENSPLLTLKTDVENSPLFSTSTYGLPTVYLRFMFGNDLRHLGPIFADFR